MVVVEWPASSGQLYTSFAVDHNFYGPACTNREMDITKALIRFTTNHANDSTIRTRQKVIGCGEAYKSLLRVLVFYIGDDNNERILIHKLLSAIASIEAIGGTKNGVLKSI